MYNATLSISADNDAWSNKIYTQATISDISTPIQIESNYTISNFVFGPIGIAGGSYGINMFIAPYTQDIPDLALNSYGANQASSYSGVAVNTLGNTVKIALPAFYRGQSLRRISGDFFAYDAFENGVTLGRKVLDAKKVF